MNSDKLQWYHGLALAVTSNAQPDIPQGQNDSVAAVTARLGPAAILAALWTLLPVACGFTLLGNLGAVSTWLRGFGGLGPWVYCGAFIVLAGLGVLPTYSVAILGGWAFGLAVGMPAAMGGFVGAAIIGYFIARGIAAERADRELARHPRWAAVRDALVHSGPLKTLGLVSLIRLPPNSPFALTNLVLSTSGVPLWSYALGTLAGMLPRTALVLWIASQVQGELSADSMRSARPGWFIPVSVAAMIAVFFALSRIVQHTLDRVTAEAGSRGPTQTHG